MELFMHILHFRSTQYLNSSCSSSNTVDSGAKITGAYGGTPLQIVPHILSYFKISSTILFGLQCEARARTKISLRIHQNTLAYFNQKMHFSGDGLAFPQTPHLVGWITVHPNEAFCIRSFVPELRPHLRLCADLDAASRGAGVPDCV